MSGGVVFLGHSLRFPPSLLHLLLFQQDGSNPRVGYRSMHQRRQDTPHKEQRRWEDKCSPRGHIKKQLMKTNDDAHFGRADESPSFCSQEPKGSKPRFMFLPHFSTLEPVGYDSTLQSYHEALSQTGLNCSDTGVQIGLNGGKRINSFFIFRCR